LVAGLVAFGDSKQMIELALAALVIVVPRLKNRPVEPLGRGKLRPRSLLFRDGYQQMSEADQLFLVAGFRRKLLELFEQIAFRPGGSIFSFLDAQVSQNLFDRDVADIFDELERAAPRRCIGRIRNDAQERKDVLDVGRFGEFDSAILAKWNPVPCELDLQIEGMRAGAKQHSDLAERHAVLAKFLDALGHEPGLLVLVARADEQWRRAFGELREQPLRITFGRLAY